MKKNTRQWGFFAILLAAVSASEHVGATTTLFRQDTALANLDVGHFPLSLSDTARELALPDWPPFQLPASFLVDWPKDTSPGEVTFGTLPAIPQLPSIPKSDEPSAATDFPSSRPRLSEGEMAVWKSNDEPEDWLFRLQFAKASIYQSPEPEPLIPIPEPTTGLLVLMGMAGHLAWRRAWDTGRNPTRSK